MKKFTGPRKLNKLKASGKSIALAAVGIVVVFIFAVGAWRTAYMEENGKGITLAYSDYYIPKTKESTVDVIRMVSALNKINTLSCPSTEMHGSVRTISCKNTSSSTPSQLFITNMNYVDGTADWYKVSPYSRRPRNEETQGDTWWSHDSVKFTRLFPEGDSDNIDDVVFPIVAPFAFEFVNANTSGKTISIVSYATDGIKYKIEFTDTLGWFCAGPADGVISKSAIEEHDAHGSVFGKAPGSYIQSGSAGSIIGYAGENTYVKCSKYDTDGSTAEWIPISLAEFYGYVS